MRNEHNWKVNKRKIFRAIRKEYKTKKGNIVKARCLKAPCTCRRKYFEKFSHEELLRLFNYFYTLSYNEHSGFGNIGYRI